MKWKTVLRADLPLGAVRVLQNEIEIVEAWAAAGYPVQGYAVQADVYTSQHGYFVDRETGRSLLALRYACGIGEATRII